jgi:hypothetical protein
MRKRETKKKMTLNSETLRGLDSPASLMQVEGGAPTNKPETQCVGSGCLNTCLC